MRPVTRFRLRTFVLLAVPFTLLMFLSGWGLTALTDDTDLGIGWSTTTALSSGIMYGLFMTLILGRAHVKGVREHTDELTAETLGVHHVRRVSVPHDRDAAFDRALAAVSALRGARVTQSDRGSGVIRAQAGATMKSWGERIVVTVTADGASGSTVTIESAPSFRWTLADYGTNLGNVVAIERALRGEEESQSQSSARRRQT